MAIPNSKVNPFIGGYIYIGVGKIGDFREKWPISRKWCEIGDDGD